jgi:hypothetical protein
VPIKRILRYLVSMPCFGICYPKGSTFDLIGYSNSDYAGCKVDSQGLVGFWEGPWCLGALRNKLPLPYPPLRPSMFPQDSVARNCFGSGKPSRTLAII